MPFLFVYSPSLIMRGLAWEIVFTFVTAVGGVWAFSAAVMGYSMRPLNAAWRLLHAATGLALLLPTEPSRTRSGPISLASWRSPS